MIIAAGTVSQNIIYEGLRVYVDGHIDNEENKLFSKKIKTYPIQH